jgi:O-antigen/teichoic acid export membrane protein
VISAGGPHRGAGNRRRAARPARGRHGAPRKRARPAAGRHPGRRPQRTASARDGQATLAGRAGKALGWSFTNNAVARFGTVGIGVMLARLLGPHAFGTYAVGYVALVALLNLNDLGVSLAIVRWPGDPAEIAPTVTTVSVVASILLYAGCYFGAPAYAAAMGAPAAVSVLRVLCLVVIVDGIVSTPVGLLQRHFRQDLKMIADQANVWLGAGVTAALAWTGFGAMSLAIGRVAGCVAALVLFVIFSPEPLRLGFNRAKAGALLKFGLPLAGSGVIVFAVTNADQLIVGRFLGVTALGFYVLAANLSNWPVTVFSQPVRSVAPAALARLQHDPPAMRRGFLSVTGLLGSVALPACLAIAGAATPLIGLVYGSRWLPAAQALIWLAVLAGLQIMFQLFYDYFVVLTASRVVFTLQLAWLVVLVPALIAGAEFGKTISAVAMTETAVAVGFVLPCYVRYLRRAGIGYRALAGRLWLPVTGAAAAGLVSMAAARLTASALVALAVSGVTGIAVIGLLGYRLRADIASLRQAGQPPAAAEPGQAGQPGQAGPSSLTEQAPLVVSAGAPMAGPMPHYRDLLQPLPLPSAHPGAPGPLPLYQQTVAALRWDPAAGRDRMAL